MLSKIGALALLALSTSALAQNAVTPPAPTAMLDTAAINAPLPADQAAMKAHVMFLASDAMKGREAGSPEFDIAAQYVAAQFYAAGLRPGGDAGGYLQTVPLTTYKAASKGDMVWTAKGGQPQTSSARISCPAPIRRRRKPACPRPWSSSAAASSRRNMAWTIMRAPT
jgi:hypothetical protein